MGKSLFVKEKAYSLEQILMSSAIMKGRMSRSRNPSANAVTITVHGTSVRVNEIVESLLRFEEHDEYNFPRIYHFDIAPSVSTLFFFYQLKIIKNDLEMNVDQLSAKVNFSSPCNSLAVIWISSIFFLDNGILLFSQEMVPLNYATTQMSYTEILNMCRN